MADLIRQLHRDGSKFSFYQAISLLEEYFQTEKNIADPLASGSIRCAPDASIVFPPSDIASVSERKGVITFLLTFMGLIGISSPLPSYFSEYISRHEENAGALRDFLYIFNHRIYVLFYQAWKKHSLGKRLMGDTFIRDIAALAGIVPQRLSPQTVAITAYAGILAGRRRGRAGLEAFIAGSFGGLPVRVQQWTPRRAPVANPKPLGEAQLGVSAIAGTTVLDIAGKIQILVGPLKRQVYESYLPGTKNIERMQQLIDLYLADPLDYDIVVMLQSVELIPVVLGQNDARLGLTSALGKTQGRSDEQSVVIERTAVQQQS